MKAHYPAEFFAGLLNAQPMGFYSPRVLVNEARREGIRILAPDINRSGIGFTVKEQGQALRIGLQYTKHLSKKALQSILEAREDRHFTSVSDLYARTEVERNGLENLIKAGFLDGLYPRPGARSRALSEMRALPKKRSSRRKKDQGAMEIPGLYEELSGAAGVAEVSGRLSSMAAGAPDGWELVLEASGSDVTDYLPASSDREEQMEWEALGLNVRRHPLASYRKALRELGATGSQEAWNLPHGTNTRVAGLLECMQRPPTKSGRPVYFLMIEDEQGLLQTTIFRPTYERYGHILHQKSAYLLEGRVEQDDRRGFSFLVQRIEDLRRLLADEELPASPAVPASGAFVRAGRRSWRAG